MTTVMRLAALAIIIGVAYLLVEPAWRTAAQRRRTRRLRVQAIALRPAPRTPEERARQRQIEALERAWMWEARR